MTSPVVTGADASRPQPRILTPSSEGSLNREDAAQPEIPLSEGHKRKSSGSVAMDYLLKPPIALKQHPPNLHVQPRVLQPLMLLPRKHFPLSCIDFNTANSELSPGRTYESHIKILDLESRMGAVPIVLLARYEPGRNVYAIERQANGLYITCRLGSWVDLNDLATHATATCQDRLRPASRPNSQGRSASMAMTAPQLHKDQKIKRAAIEAIQSLVRKRPRSHSVSTLDETAKPEETTDNSSLVRSQLPSPNLKHEELIESQNDSHPTPAPQAPIPEPTSLERSPPQQTADTIFDTIRAQYFEALYKSMGSLAYFAKGPLSRARSAFHLDLESTLDMNDLIEFLKSLILTTVQIDKKYRETIPDVIAKMKSVVESSDEARKKKRRAKKMKLGKDGLYPYEEDHIQKWWNASKPELKDDETNAAPQQIKSLASMLRTRETQLQMILILEILALTPLQEAGEAEDSQLPLLPGTAESDRGVAVPPSKKRNKHNLPVLLDVHADRLTIWQSTASDEQLLLEDSQATRQPGESQLQKASSEPLKDFCVDVIVPFFSARLPELCDSINRKLGGPTIVKPSKSKSLRRSSSKREQKPGSATKRSSLGQQPRTLQRALSTEQHHRRSVSRGPSNMIALMRSATSTSLPGIKREGSEPATSKVFNKSDNDLLNKLGGPSLSRSTSMTRLEDPKATKRARVEAELKEAISTLRKPHREIVSKELVDAAERRSSAALLVKNVPLMSTEEIIPPSSILSRIPSTGLRGGHRDVFRNSTSPTLDRIDSTPTKGSRFLDRIDGQGTSQPPWSPLMERRNTSNDNLIVPGSAVKGQRAITEYTSPRGGEILATPIKSGVKGLTDIMNGQDVPTDAKSLSIYQKLGWDDDLDDL
ncbi:DNA replication regulator SLD3-domain-containing protein [Mariannaea sp. PMI_226]|nr:DNA replication regulator SLD3-domain-containing protein [Mariannaea sp. PMI_226]